MPDIVEVYLRGVPYEGYEGTLAQPVRMLQPGFKYDVRLKKTGQILRMAAESLRPKQRNSSDQGMAIVLNPHLGRTGLESKRAPKRADDRVRTVGFDQHFYR